MSLNHNMEHIGVRIRDRRKELGLTQMALAALLGLNQGHLSRIEKGRHELTLTQLKRFQQALNCSLDSHDSENSVELFGMETLYQLSTLYDRTQFSDMLSLIHRARYAEFFLTPENRCRLMFWKARALAGINRYEEARDEYQAILDSDAAHTDMAFWANVHVYMGFAVQDLGFYEDALSHFKTALRIHQKVRRLQFNAEFLYALYYGLSTTYTYLDHMDDANKYLEKTAEVTSDRLTIHLKRHARTLFTRGSIIGLKGQYGEALELFQEALRHFEFIEATEAILHTQNNIAYVLKMLGRHDESVQLYDATVAIARQHPKLVNAELRRELAAEGYEV